LKPIGLHTDFPETADDDPKDPVDFEPETPSSKIGVEEPGTDPTRPVVSDEGNKSVSESEKNQLKQWIEYLKGKIKGAQGWIKDLLKGAEQKAEEKETKEEEQYS
jgi:hypothetical protein